MHHEAGLEIVLIGHAGHPEVVGTLGQLPAGAATLVETAADARSLQPRDPKRLAYITQTTLSVDDTAAIVAILRERFPDIVGPRKEDICYATTNRQEAVKAIAGALRPADRGGRPQQLQFAAPGGSGRARRLPQGLARAAGRRDPLGASSPASPRSASPPAPRLRSCSSSEIIDAFRARFDVRLEKVVTREERIAFNVPRELREAGAP